MNISVALELFETAHRRFSIADREKIIQVVSDFALLEEDFMILNSYIFDSNWRLYQDFTAAQRKIFSETPFFSVEQDLQGTIRIHPTMILAKKAFLAHKIGGRSPIHFTGIIMS